VARLEEMLESYIPMRNRLKDISDGLGANVIIVTTRVHDALKRFERTKAPEGRRA